MRNDYSGTEYDAWLASACMPSWLTLRILETYGSSFSCYEAFKKKDNDIMEIIPPRFSSMLQRNGSDEALQNWKEKSNQYDISVMHFRDGNYPGNLKNISDPPAMLFYRGNPDCLKNRILAMVGSRSASYAGQKASAKIAEKLSRKGITIVSGLACGIDSSAHRGCIDGGSPTIAVSGCGLDRIYPSSNISLHEKILQNNGLLISEYAPGEKPAGWHFPVRNRIISGVSEALVLMEAKIRSGSMTTVQHALEQGKDVFVYPGDPVSEYFEGNHQLLREGAIFFTDAGDILQDMGWLDNPSTVGQNIDCSGVPKSFKPEEKAVIEALKPGTLGFEQLLKQTGLDPSALMSTLTILQINGEIEALPGKIYQVKE